jgi:uncharacterized protein YihD (DUF1040 family)
MIKKYNDFVKYCTVNNCTVKAFNFMIRNNVNEFTSIYDLEVSHAFKTKKEIDGLQKKYKEDLKK